MARTASLGLLNSINHPLLAPWAWEFPEADLRHVHCLEIWNDPSWSDNVRDNPRAVALWTQWLNAGHRITALGGSDYHRPQPLAGQDKPPERLGLPSTYVYAQNLSGRAVLDAVRERRAYVSMGPTVTFQACHAETVYEIGADLGEVDGEIELIASVAGAGPPARARLVKNGQAIAEARTSDGRTELTARVGLDRSEAAWFRLDVLGADSLLLAITNPIFAGPLRAPQGRLFGDFA
jgi:hypothetical protein